jgi:predicted amidohydrolase YtcJ
MRVGLIPRIYEAEYDLDEVVELMADPLPGDRLSWQGVKISIDGYYGDLSARQHAPYAGTRDSYGRWRIDAATLADRVLDSHRRGLRVCLHANGAAAVDAALDAYEHALSTVPCADHRHRIEHFGNEVLTDEQVRRCRDLGVVVVPNPPVWRTETPHVRRHLAGNPDFRPLNLRRMVDAGLLIGLAGDNQEPLEPLASVAALATRLLEDGSVDQPDQAVTPWETLRIYTAVNAWLGRHDRSGVLAPGMDADLVWVDADPLAAPVPEIANIAVRGTMVAGRWEYGGE